VRSFYSAYGAGIFYRHTVKRALGSGGVLLVALAFIPDPAWPCAAKAKTAAKVSKLFGSAGANRDLLSAEDELIRKQPLCIAHGTWSAGNVGDTVLYRYTRVGNELRVGYFVYWSTERPWGANSLTYTLLPAVAIDTFYSHALFLLPGARHVMYGPGDVEGALVVYEKHGDRLRVLRGFADDGTHQPSQLASSELQMPDGRTVLRTDVWSHQLGAHGAAQYATQPQALMHCFSGETLQPLTPEVAQQFRLGSTQTPLRGRPAWRNDTR
jgi:hypothetical protein